MIKTFKNTSFITPNSFAFVLGLISEISKQYLVLEIDSKSFTSKELRIFENDFTKNHYPSFYGSIEDLKKESKIKVYSQFDILDLYDTQSWGLVPSIDSAEYNSDTTLKIGEEVKFNFRTYSVISIMFNKYAQLNIGTPILLATDELMSFYKDLLFSKMSDERILTVLNTKWKSDHFDNDITAPILNIFADEWTESIKVIEPAPTSSDVMNLVSRIRNKQNSPKVFYSAKRNIIKDIVLSENESELADLQENRPKVFEALMSNFLKPLNDAVNKKVELLHAIESNEKEPIKRVPLDEQADWDDILNELESNWDFTKAEAKKIVFDYEDQMEEMRVVGKKAKEIVVQILKDKAKKEDEQTPVKELSDWEKELIAQLDKNYNAKLINKSTYDRLKYEIEMTDDNLSWSAVYGRDFPSDIEVKLEAITNEYVAGKITEPEKEKLQKDVIDEFDKDSKPPKAKTEEPKDPTTPKEEEEIDFMDDFESLDFDDILI